MIKKDRLGTIAKHYLDPKSYVTPDGREVLFGEDWKARVEDLRLRSGGRCEWIETGDRVEWSEGAYSMIPRPMRCDAKAQDPHHIIRRSVKRDDRLANLQALCRFHHDLLDERKPRWAWRRPQKEAAG